MKKFIIAILAVLYLSAASGIEVNLHYCMGKLDSVTYFLGEQGENCGKCGMDNEPAGCCHSESQVVKLEDDHKATQVEYNFADHIASPALIIVPFRQIRDPWKSHSQLNSPPLAEELYLRNCTFRI